LINTTLKTMSAGWAAAGAMHFTQIEAHQPWHWSAPKTDTRITKSPAR
jgi:hypothetical protein